MFVQFCSFKLKIEEITMATRSFDPEGAKIYKLLSEQHRHEKGPWKKMLEKVVAHTNGTCEKDIMILDLASGPGEPATTIARALPNVSVNKLGFNMNT